MTEQKDFMVVDKNSFDGDKKNIEDISSMIHEQDGFSKEEKKELLSHVYDLWMQKMQMGKEEGQ